ncbi:DUF350 domain-containing protein [Microtetraspora malaysiensis]|uniref:DUF350 domain-containing protein n=1 Tax=Microtetraspora malaysiensis TaxID=161358 RepID=A0ABW6SV67_9ACTN|nr:DUF350 domain-containing protein [Microtetraspora malaysiensis]
MVTTQSTPFTEVLGNGALAIGAYAVLGVLLLVAGFYAIDLATPGRLSRLIREERNPNAAALAAAGLVAVGLIVAASIWSSGGALREGLIATLVFGLVGIAVQTIAMIAFDRVVGIPVRTLLGETTLQPATIMLSATHVVIGLITAVAVV